MEMKRRKSWMVAVLMGMLTLLLIACGNGADEGGTDDDAGTGDKVELEFWSFWGGGARRETIETIIEEYNASQDEVEVTHVYQPWGDIWTKSLAAIASGNDVPDVIVQDIMTVRQRADANQATNLQEYIDQEDEEMEALFYPQLWDTVLHEDEAYGLPFNTDTHVLFYNKDLFEEAGLDPEAPPTTRAELEEMARTLDVQEGDSWEKFGYYPLWNSDMNIWGINADSGTSWFDEENNVMINTPNKVATLEWILEWQEYYGRDTINGFQAEFGSGVADPFISGLVAMRTQNINYYKEISENAPEDFNFGVAPLPEFQEGTGNWTWGGGFALEIPYGAEHPDASYEFMKYLTSTEVQEKFGLTSFDIMANQQANQNLVQNNELEEEAQMIFQLADTNFENTVLTPVPLVAPDFNSLINGQIDEALLGNVTAQEALDNAQASVENLVEQNE